MRINSVFFSILNWITRSGRHSILLNFSHELRACTTGRNAVYRAKDTYSVMYVNYVVHGSAID